MRKYLSVALVLFASSALAQPTSGRPIPGPILKKTLITHFAAGFVECKGPGVSYRREVTNPGGISVFYYDHDPRRIWIDAGWRMMLGYDVSCEYSGAESSDLR